MYESIVEDGAAIFYTRPSDTSFQAFRPSSLQAMCTMCLYPLTFILLPIDHVL